ncbi:MAG: hypothetical protein WC623_13555 [Pedobacter sp.]|uniref:hypothetical protein n=1 Tax=Pedobacter sp. TaxID=1411316 RepID=UPI003566487A
MSDFKLDLNFDRLKDYFPNITEEQKARIKQQGGLVPNLEWDYADNAVHFEMFNALLVILKRYHLEDHINELYYTIIILNDNCQVAQEIEDEAYNNSQTTKEVAQFLLTHKTANPNQAFQLVAKSATNTAPIKNTEVAQWMCELIYAAIESKQFPMYLLGEHFISNVFGTEISNDSPISMERLEVASNLKIKKPSNKSMLVSFCLQLRTYLNAHTQLSTPSDILITNAQANFFFDVLELYGYLNRNKIESEPKDYIHALLRNHLIKVTPS